jgi:hypothetical protein
MAHPGLNWLAVINARISESRDVGWRGSCPDGQFAATLTDNSLLLADIGDASPAFGKWSSADRFAWVGSCGKALILRWNAKNHR